MAVFVELFIFPKVSAKICVTQERQLVWTIHAKHLVTFCQSIRNLVKFRIFAKIKKGILVSTLFYENCIRVLKFFNHLQIIRRKIKYRAVVCGLCS